MDSNKDPLEGEGSDLFVWNWQFVGSSAMISLLLAVERPLVKGKEDVQLSEKAVYIVVAFEMSD